MTGPTGADRAQAWQVLRSSVLDQIWTAAARRDGQAVRDVLDSLVFAGFPRTAIVIRDTLHAQNVGGWADVVFGDVDYLPGHEHGAEVTVVATPVFQIAVEDVDGDTRTFGGVLTAAGLLRIEVPSGIDRSVLARLETCTEVCVTGRVDRSGPRPTLVLSMIEPVDRAT
jgi:hypothetical protein